MINWQDERDQRPIVAPERDGLKPDERAEQTIAGLRRLIATHGPALVLTHDNPDPDAVSAALAMAETLRCLGAPEVVAAFRGLLGRPENEALVEVLGLPFIHLADVATAQFDFAVLVDVQPGAGNLSLPDWPPVLAVLDHHPLRPESLALPVHDVRPEVGSSATLAYHLLTAAGGTPPPELATALFYGIKTDTQDLSRVAAPLDLAAYRALVTNVDHRALAQIERPALSVQHFEVLRRALERAYVYDGVLLTTVEALPHPAAAAEIADLLVRTEGVSWSACAGIVGDSVYYSIRTTDTEGNAGEIAARVAKPGGSGGGHWPMAAGRVPRSAFPGYSLNEIIVEMIRRLVAAFDLHGVEPRKLLRWRERNDAACSLNPPPDPTGCSPDVQPTARRRT